MADRLGNVQHSILTALDEHEHGLTVSGVTAVLSRWAVPIVETQIGTALRRLARRGYTVGDDARPRIWRITDAGRDRLEPTCAEPDCNEPRTALGLCPKHHSRLSRTGTTELPTCGLCAQCGVCDKHHPTVCICDSPVESRDGQCGACFRPYRVRNSELPMVEVREAWRKLVTGRQP